MTVSLKEMLAQESEESRWRIEKRTAELIAEELHLRELRRLRKLTQTKLSKKLKIGQEGISRMEKRADMYISTLRGYVEGVGGKLSLVVEFPDQQPVILAGLGLDEGKPGKKAGKKTGKAALAKVKTRGKSVAKSASKMLQSA
jgi:DNA-binding XRE family transcriptional regulator